MAIVPLEHSAGIVLCHFNTTLELFCATLIHDNTILVVFCDTLTHYNTILGVGAVAL